MKILLACNSKDNYKTLYDESGKTAKGIADSTLRLFGRLGYAHRLFVPIRQQKKYYQAIKDCNYDWYYGLDKNIVLAGQTAEDHAKRNGFDLLVTIPDDLVIPVGKAEDRYMIAFSRRIEQARVGFETGEYKKKKALGAGVIMEKI